MKELVDALKERFSSPLFGYFGLLLIALNWEAWFYLFVQQGDAANRIQYFEEHTTAWSVIFWPLVLSFSISALHPWITLCVAWLTVKPIEIHEMIQATSEHALLLKKRELEDARSNLLASAENELIDRAKRDDEINLLQNQELRDSVREELAKLRAEREALRAGTPSQSPQVNYRDLFDIAEKYRTRAENTTSDQERAYYRQKASELENQAHRMIKSVKQ